MVNAIKQYMDEHNLTQLELAQMVGIDQGTVSKHLQGRGMRLETALLYHQKLGIPLEELQPNNQEQEPKNGK